MCRAVHLICILHLQANGLVLSAGNVVVVAITATLAAIGSASIPNSALVSMVTVLQVFSPDLCSLINYFCGQKGWINMTLTPKI